MPIAIEGIVWYSEDLNRARAFYRDVLGLPLLLDEDHVIHFDAGTVRLAIHRCPPGELATRKTFRSRVHAYPDGRDRSGTLVWRDGLGDRPRDDDQRGPSRHQPHLRLRSTSSERDQRGRANREAFPSPGPQDHDD